MCSGTHLVVDSLLHCLFSSSESKKQDIELVVELRGANGNALRLFW